MGKDVPDEELSSAISNIGDEAKFVSTNIENDEIFNFVRAREQIFNVLKRGECRFFNNFIPSVHALLGVWMNFTKFFYSFAADYMHYAPMASMAFSN